MPRPFLDLVHRFNPRHHLSAAIGWLVFALALTLAVAASFWVGKVVRATFVDQHAQRLASVADHVASELNIALTLRLQSVSLAAAMLAEDLAERKTDRLNRVLGDVRRNFPDFLWIGAAYPDGQVIAATDADVLGRNVHDYAWFAQGLLVAWIEEGVDFNTPEYARTGRGQHFLNLTAPVRSGQGAAMGVVAARLSWAWLEQLAGEIGRGLGPDSREQWLLIDRNNVVRIGPEVFMGKAWQDESDASPVEPTVVLNLGLKSSDLPAGLTLRQWAGGKSYLVANAKLEDNDALQLLGWRVVVVQPLGFFTELVLRTQWQIVAILFGLGIAAALLGVWLGRRLTRRLRLIASSADAVLAGTAQQIAVPAGEDEAARLGAALDRLLTALQRERDELKQLNAELDQRVAERTQEIQRMGEEARYAAVVRERLKIARDLHDTLAHSMMAMLTEIRLLKKLAATRPEALAEELAEAEKAAHQGLQEARAAIAQIRYNPVRDVGLGVALQDHLQLFGDRTGLACHFECDPSLATFSEERAETLFRIAEEALRNIERHAGAGKVTVSLQLAEQGRVLQMGISDDGVGFETGSDHPGHYGLVGLREQAQLIGAQLLIVSLPSQGTRLTVTLRLGDRAVP